MDKISNFAIIKMKIIVFKIAPGAILLEGVRWRRVAVQVGGRGWDLEITGAIKTGVEAEC